MRDEQPVSARRRWVRRLVALAIFLGAAALGVYLAADRCASFGAHAKGERLARMRSSPHFRNGAFVNAEPTGLMKPESFWPVARAWVASGTMRVPPCPLPMVTDTADRLRTPPSSGLRITWLGHSTTLIEIDGQRILTDPHWSQRASPVRFAGPRRFHPPPLDFADVPPLDAVVISHDHYDHLDMDTIRALAKRAIPFLVGLGMGAHLERWGVLPERIHEMDAWGTHLLPGGVQVTSVPSRHFSGRALFDRNEKRWSAWALVGPRHRVFFSGDTGRTEQFAEARNRLGPFDVALLEIGAFHPSWGDIHLGPDGALEMFQLLGARALFPIHWSTFDLGLHAWSEPAETLYREGAERHIPLLTPKLGEPVEPGDSNAGEPWWRVLPPLAAHCPPT
jgi:L-ascorbate metabolism protein UlaG (beta-lactamase superfamily)